MMIDFEGKLQKTEVEIIKAKLKTFGKLRSKRIVLEARLKEILASIGNHDDFPKKAAQELGIRSLDADHPAEQQLIIEKTMIEKELQNVKTEIAYLGLDDFFASLDLEEYQIVELVFILGLDYRESGLKMNLTHAGIYKRIKKIFEKI